MTPSETVWGAVEVDAAKVAGLGLIAAEHPKGQGSDEDPPSAVGGQVVEADGAGNRLRAQKHGSAPAGQGCVDDVAPAHDEAAGRVKRHAADTTAFGNHERDLATEAQQVDAAVLHIAEI
jgi:hypothetical protein